MSRCRWLETHSDPANSSPSLLGTAVEQAAAHRHLQLFALLPRHLHRGETLRQRGGVLVEGRLWGPLRELEEAVVAEGDNPDPDGAGLAAPRLDPPHRPGAGELQPAFGGARDFCAVQRNHSERCIVMRHAVGEFGQRPLLGIA
jgi:hypothetical protein